MSSEIDDIHDRAELVRRVASGLRPEYLFFWGHTGTGVGKWIFSQWYPAPFVVDAVRYATAEHWMMSEKARLFGDEEALARILADDDPSAAKAAGRAVRGYEDDAWCARRVGAVREGNVHKFRQNPEMGAYLLATRGRVLVEAAPRDTIWGIGLGAENPAARDPAKWRGQNLLGFALMWTRVVLAASS